MNAFAPLSRTLPYWPHDLLGPPGGQLDLIGFSEFDIASSPTALAFSGKIAWLQEIEFAIPAMDGASFAFLDGGGFTEIGFNLEVTPEFSLTFGELSAEFRFVSEALRPVKWNATASKWMPVLNATTNQPAPAVFGIGNMYLHADGEGQIAFVDDQGQVAFPSITPPSLEIAGSGIVLEMTAVKLFLSQNQTPPPGAPQGFKGVAISAAIIHLGDAFGSAAAPTTVSITDLLIGSSGFSGKIAAAWVWSKDSNGSYTGTGLGQFLGLQFGLKSLGFVFSQNRLTGSSIKGMIKLPFFEKELDVEIGYDANGKLTVGIDSTSGDGLAKLTIDNVLELELDSLKFEVEDGLLTATMSGKMTPKVPGLKWPTIDLKDLKIDSKGNVKLPGGWLDLPKQYGFDFHGVKVDITKFGMGRNEDGTKWIGFSGGVNFVKGLKGGASVEGLRITADKDWTPSSAKVSFNGIGVEMKNEAFAFKGSVAFREFTDPISNQDVRRFDGQIKLRLNSIKMDVEGQLVIGSVAATATTPGYKFFAIYVGVELTTGIPLASTGLGLFGFAGLLAIGMEPDKHADEPWYGIAPSEGWYKRGTVGVSDLTKWRNQDGSMAFGAGVTLGTYSDNGFTFNGKVLLAIVFPGPIVLLEGKANLLKDRAKLSSGEPMFRSLAVLDNRAGSLLIGLDVKYQYDKNEGKVIKIGAGTEAYYKFSDPMAWHIYLGENEPRERRIQARILSLFDANAYLMLDARKLAMGSWVGLDRNWQYGPLSVKLQAWMENNAILSFKPAHLHGDLWAHGAVELAALGFGMGLTIDARLEADVRTPFHVLGEFDVEFRLPWPLKKKHFDAHVKLEWPEAGSTQELPPVPVPLKEVAIEHFKVGVKWPLSKAALLLVPNYAHDEEGFLDFGVVAPDETLGPPTDLPVVPVDCRPSLSFGRNVHDDALVGGNAHPLTPEYEQIGDPSKNQGPGRVRYGLKELWLESWTGSSWEAIAGKGTGVAAMPELFGTWAPVPNGDGLGQNKLLIWSKSGFDHLRHNGPEWADWFASHQAGYPCFANPEVMRVCLDFMGYDVTKSIRSPLIHSGHGGVRYRLANKAFPRGYTVTDDELAILPAPAWSDPRNVLTARDSDGADGILVSFDQPVNHVHLEALTEQMPLVEGVRYVQVYVWDDQGTEHGPFPLENNALKLQVNRVLHVLLLAEGEGAGKVCLQKVCGDMRPGAAQLAQVEAIRDNNRSSTARWSEKGNVLEPFTQYRLRIVTTVNADFSPTQTLTQFAYFQTKGPPGISELSRPSEPPYPEALIDPSKPDEFQSGLNDLTRYVKQTIPPTVSEAGEPPLLPRPVYRGYDVSVLFNEDYVDLMYRHAGRDLALLLYDRNNQPLRDHNGRLVVPESPWSEANEVSVSPQEQQWCDMVNANPCGVPPILPGDIAKDQILKAVHERQILDADALYDARLMPLLLREDFRRFVAGAVPVGGNLGRWKVQDLMLGAFSQWEIEALGSLPEPRPRQLVQKAAIGANGGGMTAVPVLNQLGTLLVLGNDPKLPIPDLANPQKTDQDQPSQWTDYRLSLKLGSSQDGAIGVAFRYSDAQNFYLFTMDRPSGLRQLLKIRGGAVTVLASDQFNFELSHGYRLVIEAIGSSLRIYLDDEKTFDVTDAELTAGGLALQCGVTGGAAFSDIHVHDFSKSARCVYRFPFTTSEYVDFFHHMHSFEDECWKATCHTPLATASAHAVVNPTDAITDDESRAFETLADEVLGTAALQCAERTEFTRIDFIDSADPVNNLENVAMLLRMAEPIDWKRIKLTLSELNQAVPAPIAPLKVKLVAAKLGAQAPADEEVILLIREATNLTGHRIEMREIVPGTTLPLDSADVDAPKWEPIYSFGDEAKLAAGTRVIVSSGNAPANATTEPRTQRRYGAAAGDPGQLRFTSTTVDLRIVAPRGDVIHARRFLDTTAISSQIGFKLLRKADGTACFILPTQPSVVSSSGPQRLTMMFVRDNTATEPDSIIMSSVGQTMDEVAVLDIPGAMVL